MENKASESMKVAVVHSFYSRQSPSGENTVVLDQVNQLQEAGHEVLLISKETDSESNRRLYGLRAALTTANIAGSDPSSQLTSFNPDVVHVHNLFPNWRSTWLSFWGRKTVQTLHNYRAVCAAATLFREGRPCTECLDRNSIRAIVHKCYRGSTVATLPLAIANFGDVARRPTLAHPHTLITLNSTAEDLYRTYLPESRIVTVPNFANARAQPSSQRRNRFIYVGRLTDEKGIVQLLRSWPVGLALDIVGSGPLDSTVSELVESSSLDIRMLGRKDSHKTLDLIAASDGLVIPSLWSEGIPTVALESLAVGTPLVVSDKLASVKALTANGSGAVYSPFGESSLSAALDSVLRQGAEMRMKARSNYSRKFGVDVWQRSIDIIYERVVADNAA